MPKLVNFYENKVEVTWDDVVESKTVVENKPKEVEEGDVIVESIKEINTKDELSLETSSYETEKERNVSIEIDAAKNETPKVITKESTPKLFKVVPPIPLEENIEYQVFLSDLESTSKAWICRNEDEDRVNNIMDRLASLSGRFFVFTCFHMGFKLSRSCNFIFLVESLLNP